MYNSNIPSDRELPSTGKLIKSTILAVAVAAVLLVTVVIPAEYGIDPTGVGDMLGLTSMGKIKMSLAVEATRGQTVAAEIVKNKSSTREVTNQPPVLITETIPPVVPTAEPVPVKQRNDEMKVTLTPDQGTEIKLTLKKGEKVDYKWFSSGGNANYDLHGDSQALSIDYHSYGKGIKVRDEGNFEAAFDGHHGWFWRNRTAETITVTLQTVGTYSDIKHLN